MSRAVRWAYVAACLAWMLASAPVHADALELWPESGRGALAGHVGYYGTDQGAATQRVISPTLAGMHAFDRRWSMSAEGGFLWIGADPERGDADGAFAIANPTGLAYFTPRPEAEHRLRLAVGGSLPLSLVARGARGRLQRAGISTAGGMQGLARPDLWAPSRGSFVALLQLQGPLSDKTSYDIHLRPALPLAIVRRAGENIADLFVPVSVGLVSRNARFEGGLRLQAVFMPTSNVDQLQLALSPHARVLHEQRWLGVRLLAPLDEPLAGRRGPRLWGLYLEAGGAL